MLSGENPNQIGRELRYLGYVSLAQSKVITELDNNLRAVEENKTKAEEARAVLEEIAQEQREQKALLEKVEKVHEQNTEHIKELLLDKLQTLLKEKSSAGVSNNFGEMLIPKGSKFNQKNLVTLDYQNVNPLGWTGDEKIDQQINTLLHNYSIRFNEELGRYKREKFNISIGDELPAGV